MNKFIYRAGLSADDVLEIVDRTGRKLIHRAIVTDRDRKGLTVLWFYQDATLTLKRVRGCYRIVRVSPPSTPDELVEIDKKYPDQKECPKCHSPVMEADYLIEGHRRYICFRCGLVSLDEEE